MNDTMVNMPTPTSTTAHLNGHSTRLTHHLTTAQPRPATAAKKPGWWTTQRARVARVDSVGRILGLYYAAVVSGAVWGGTEAATGWLEQAIPVAAFMVVTGELSGVAFGHMADKLQRDSDRSLLCWFCWFVSAAVAAAAMALQYVGHMAMGKPIQAYFFAGLSGLGYLAFVIRAAMHRRKSRGDSGKTATPAPSFGLVQWLREPKVTAVARSLARNAEQEMTRAQALRAAKIRLGLEKWIAMSVRTATAGKDAAGAARARAMLTVHPVDIVAAELAKVVDRDTYVSWLASQLDPRVMTGNKAAPPPPAMPNPGQVVAAIERASARRPVSASTRRAAAVPKDDQDRYREFLRLEAQGLTRAQIATRMGYAQARGLTKLLARVGHTNPAEPTTP